MNNCSIYSDGDNHEFTEDQHIGNTRTHKMFKKECYKCGRKFIDYENKKTQEFDFMEEIK